MGYLQLLRIGLVGLVLTSALVTPNVVGSSFAELAPIAGSYAALSAVAEALRRASRRRSLGALSWMLLVDGVFLAWVMHLTGGIESPLRFLVFVHVVAVSLLASYRTGLKLALWHSLLLISLYESEAAGILTGVGEQSPGAAAFQVTALWVVAGITALFSGLNERELRRRRSDLEALAAMAAELESAVGPEDVADVLLKRVMETFQFRRGLVLGLREGAVTILATTTEGPAVEPPARPDTVLRAAWRAKQPALVRSLDPKGDRWLRQALPDASNIAVFPMAADGQPLGALVVEQSGAPKVQRRMIVAAEQFVSHGALALLNALLLQRVQLLAERDPLTGLCNRRTFERELARNLARSGRSGEPLTLAMIDIDHFKRHNDRYGHQAGDEVLRRAGEALSAASRTSDTVARYGGEEFAVIMPGLSPAEALEAVERLRAAIAGSATSEPVTASAGIATYPTNARDAEALIRNADEALYVSKARGRDRSTRSRRRGGLRSVALNQRAV